MPRSKYVYWCISHQQQVAPKALRVLRDQMHCTVVKLNITILRQVDLLMFASWINSEISSRNTLSGATEG